MQPQTLDFHVLFLFITKVYTSPMSRWQTSHVPKDCHGDCSWIFPRSMTGWWFQPSWKIWKSMGRMTSHILLLWKIKFMFQTTNQHEKSFEGLNPTPTISQMRKSPSWGCTWGSTGSKGNHHPGGPIHAPSCPCGKKTECSPDPRGNWFGTMSYHVLLKSNQ